METEKAVDAALTFSWRTETCLQIKANAALFLFANTLAMSTL